MKTYTSFDIYKALKSCLKDDEDFLMHLSFKSLGNLENGFEDLFSGIKMRDGGTSMFGAFSFYAVTKENPNFDLENTPVSIGAFPEWLRKCDGVKRSIHPTHSVLAYGERRDKYIENHEKDSTPCGKNSPLMKLTEVGGKILMVGCGLKPNTTMHGIEELIETPYVLEKHKTKYHIKAGDEEWDKEYFAHWFSDDDGYHYAQRYDRVEDIMKIEKKEFLDTFIYIIPADELREKAGNMIKKNPLYFVDRVREL